MTNKIILFVFLISLFLLSRPLWAQSAQSQTPRHYVIEQRYVQQLVWIGDKYTLKYEVVIEQNDGGKYKAYIQEFTEKPSFLVSLPSGKYRYRIIPYDYLEQPGEASDWVNIEIKPSPVVSADVQKTDDRNQTPSADENKKIAPDIKEAVINNTDDSAVTKENETEKPLNLYVSAAWTPLIPLYGRLQEIFGNEFYAGGATVRFGALYNKLQWFSPGVEISTSWYAFNNDQGGDGISVQTGVTGFNIVAQKELPFPKMAVALRTGFALAYQVGEINIDDYSYTTGGLIPQINIEASFLWFAYKRLYLEAGIGFTHLLGKDNNSGFLRPWIGAGWEF
jgi:hypothetical protein